MPSLNTTATVTTSKEVKLSVRVTRKLLTELRGYAELKAQRNAIDAAMDGHKAAIEALRETTGEQKILLEGFSVALVSPVRSSLDKKRLLEAGVSMAQIEAGTVTRPTKPYTKVTVPGEKGDSE